MVLLVSMNVSDDCGEDPHFVIDSESDESYVERITLMLPGMKKV